MSFGHELLTTSAHRELGLFFTPQIRAYQYTALSNPCPAYISCRCCRADDGNISPTLPDLTICHRLLEEHGSMVNLADWAMQFRQVLSSLEQPNVDELDEEWTKLVQARFVRCIEDLQWMGYVRKTKRRLDHVEKCL
jgi:hypothetical protein